MSRMEAGAEYDLERVKVVSPASSMIRPLLGCAILAMAAHGRRHLWQARQLPGAELPG